MARTIAKDHDEKRIKILKTAARVFAEEGFSRASMSQVARDCQISKANIYHYYDSKHALLFDILDSYLRELRDQMSALALDDLVPEERLRRVVTEILTLYEGMDDEHKIQTEGIQLLAPQQQMILRGYQRELVDQVSGILGEIAPESFADDKKKLRAATMSVFGMLNWFYMWNSRADRSARKAYANMVTDLTLNGIGGL